MATNPYQLRRPCPECPFTRGPRAVRLMPERVIEVTDAVFGAMRKREYASRNRYTGNTRVESARAEGIDAISIHVQRIPHRELVERALRKRGEGTTALAKKHARMIIDLGGRP